MADTPRCLRRIYQAGAECWHGGGEEKVTRKAAGRNRERSIRGLVREEFSTPRVGLSIHSYNVRVRWGASRGARGVSAKLGWVRASRPGKGEVQPPPDWQLARVHPTSARRSPEAWARLSFPEFAAGAWRRLVAPPLAPPSAGRPSDISERSEPVAAAESRSQERTRRENFRDTGKGHPWWPSRWAGAEIPCVERGSLGEESLSLNRDRQPSKA